MISHSYKLTAILFGIGVTLHNLEEAMYMVSWARSHCKLCFEPNRKIYWVLTSLMTIVIWIPIVGVCVSKESSSFQSAPLRICPRHGGQGRAAPLDTQPG